MYIFYVQNVQFMYIFLLMSINYNVESLTNEVPAAAGTVLRGPGSLVQYHLVPLLHLLGGRAVTITFIIAVIVVKHFRSYVADLNTREVLDKVLVTHPKLSIVVEGKTKTLFLLVSDGSPLW